MGDAFQLNAQPQGTGQELSFTVMGGLYAMAPHSLKRIPNLIEKAGQRIYLWVN